MQTFLPESTFLGSARVLDNKRLGKQRVENLQILNALVLGKGWVNHPATKMWADHLDAFWFYHQEICSRWTSLGFKDTCRKKFDDVWFEFGPVTIPNSFDYPDWYNEDFIRAHRSNLVRKDPEHYRAFWPDVPDDLPYIWPV